MATLRQRNGSWVLTWSDSGGQHRKTIGRVGQLTEREARGQLLAKEHELHVNRGLAPSVVPSFEAFATAYLAWREHEYPDSAKHIQSLVDTHLVPFFGHHALDTITPRLVEAYKLQRRPECRAATLDKELRTLKAMMARAVEWGELPANPVSTVKQPQLLDSKPPTFYTPEQLSKLYIASPAPYRAIWQLLANTGLRRGEAQHLRWANVQDTKIVVTSQTGARTKSGRWRDIPISPGARAALDALRGQNDLHVLPRGHIASLSRAFRKAARRAGVPGSLHTLRHTFISTLVAAGVPLRTVQVLAGHSTIAVTERYAHVAPDAAHAALQNLSL